LSADSREPAAAHDYKRHGTTTLFAALDVLECKVIGRCMQRHRHQEFIRFLNAIEAQVPASKLVHVPPASDRDDVLRRECGKMPDLIRLNQTSLVASKPASSPHGEQFLVEALGHGQSGKILPELWPEPDFCCRG
jgi:hypothetical protein